MFRIHYEMRTQEHLGWFLTLTYDEKHVCRRGGRLSLRFRDVQLFLKRIRKDKFYAKYICVGEYGGQTRRPHYHMLLWTDCPPDTIESYWQQGRIHFGELTMASAMYTLKYIIQPKQEVEKDLDGRVIVEKTRAQFSKGLGLGYLTTPVYYYHTEDYENPVLSSRIDGKMVALPRYYRNKIFTRHQMRINAWKISLKQHKEKRKKIRALRDQGINDAHAYIKRIRIEEAARIIKKTKFNTTL